jgi:two-component system cell cycle response regulator
MARILVIEDNLANLELMTYLLSAFGHTVLAAGDGEQGIDSAVRERPDLVLCDVLLPGLDGYAVARALRADPATASIPVVAVSALAMEGDREKGLAAGFSGYISKPIDPETFVAEADTFLAAGQRGALPRDRHAAAPPSEQAQRAALGTLLVVDDSPTNRELIEQTLAPFGFDVRLAASVSAAMEMLAEAVPDLILSDLHMPEQDGFKLIRQVKADARLRDVPFVFISSSIWGEGDRERALALGVSRFLLRPIEPQALLGEVSACLAAAKEGHGDDPER